MTTPASQVRARAGFLPWLALTIPLAAATLFSTGSKAQEAATEPTATEHAAETPHYPLEKPERQEWSFDGPFGKFDPEQLQRGLDVYRQVCESCHALGLVAFRTLASETGPWLTVEAMEAVARTYQVEDADTGDMRPGRPADRFPAEAPAASAFAAPPPDLSLMAKARGVSPGFPGWLIDGLLFYQEAGADYIYSLLTGYHEPDAEHQPPPGLFYNPYFAAGAYISMPPPLSDGAVPYPEGVPATVEQYAKDVSAFLMWTAEPHLTDRKHLGLQVMVFLLAFTVLLFLTKKRIWSRLH